VEKSLGTRSNGDFVGLEPIDQSSSCNRPRSRSRFLFGLSHTKPRARRKTPTRHESASLIYEAVTFVRILIFLGKPEKSAIDLI
jgi:hypothetical protein